MEEGKENAAPAAKKAKNKFTFSEALKTLIKQDKHNAKVKINVITYDKWGEWRDVEGSRGV